MAEQASQTRSGPVAIRRRTALLVLGLLSAQFAALALIQAWNDAPTADEPIYIASGVTALTRHQFRVNVETAPLPKLLAALPVLAAKPVIPEGSNWEKGQPGYTADFMAAQNRAGKARRVIFLARVVPVIEGILVGVVAYALAAGLFGRLAGLLAAGLWLTTAFVLGTSHLVGVDVPNALVLCLGCLCLSRYLRDPSTKWAAAVGVVGGLGLLTRVSNLLLVPVFAFGVVVGDWRRAARALGRGALVVVLAWATVWGGVRAVAPSVAPGFGTSYTCLVPAPATERAVQRVPWPAEYRRAFTFHLRCSTQATPAYLLGRYWVGARWWYWPASALVKLPISVIGAIVGGLLCWLTLERPKLARALLAVLLPAAVHAIFTIQVPRPLGLRYLLPTIALLLVAASALVRLAPRPRLLWVALGVIGVVQIPSYALSLPHSLAWTAPPFRPGYQVATDANLDWGQDLYRLRSWSKGRQPYVAYYGPGYTEVPGTRSLLGTQPRRIRGWVAVSATLLNKGRRRELSWLRAYCPVGTLGGTIVLYYFEEPPDVRPGPTRPASVCEDGARSSTREAQ